MDKHPHDLVCSFFSRYGGNVCIFRAVYIFSASDGKPTDFRMKVSGNKTASFFEIRFKYFIKLALIADKHESKHRRKLKKKAF